MGVLVTFLALLELCKEQLDLDLAGGAAGPHPFCPGRVRGRGGA